MLNMPEIETYDTNDGICFRISDCDGIDSLSPWFKEDLLYLLTNSADQTVILDLSAGRVGSSFFGQLIEWQET
jgi:hypothetical protein